MLDFGSFDRRGYRRVTARDGYAQWAATYERTIKRDMDIRLLDAIRTVRWGDVSYAVDLGCGTGRTGLWLAAHGVRRHATTLSSTTGRTLHRSVPIPWRSGSRTVPSAHRRCADAATGYCAHVSANVSPFSRAVTSSCSASAHAAHVSPRAHPSGTGPCGPTGLTTVWMWLSRLDASSFAGHGDWRLPSQAARNTCPVGEPNRATTATPRELETIVHGAPASCTPACSYPIFGVPVASQTWSSSTATVDPRFAWLVNFFTGVKERVNKRDGAVSVRAVRTEQ